MTKVIKVCGIVALLLASGSAFADDPTGVMLANQGYTPTYPGHLPAFSDGGPCYRGMQQEAFPNHQGYRCVPTY